MMTAVFQYIFLNTDKMQEMMFTISMFSSHVITLLLFFRTLLNFGTATLQELSLFPESLLLSLGSKLIRCLPICHRSCVAN
jgi:hypothetical protein